MILHTSNDTKQKNTGACSIVVPIYNEENVIPQFHSRLNRVVKLLDMQVHVIYVNDGSYDNSTQIIEKLTNLEYDFTLINLSRNFGKEAAMSAGLSKADGDFTIILDVDLQDPPELIPSMTDKWREGADIVCMQRNKRYGESWFKKVSAFLFYKIINRLADCDIPENVGDFRLLDKKVVRELIQLREKIYT
ncbi:glycosyltransferase family 2 protein [Psychromonas sp. KJ10-2]|uniref:glycosyltransferase family 2 protein n=1 Tax=Psychromonas sp. KJ10-2 TaxID=3391822 RepID=UPI0039B3A0AD